MKRNHNIDDINYKVFEIGGEIKLMLYVWCMYGFEQDVNHVILPVCVCVCGCKMADATALFAFSIQNLLLLAIGSAVFGFILVQCTCTSLK